MLKRQSNEKTGHGKTKQVKCSHLQEREDKTVQAGSSLDSGVHSMDVDENETEVTSQSTIAEEHMTGNNSRSSDDYRYSLNEDDNENVVIPQSSTSENSGESRAGDNDTYSNRRFAENVLCCKIKIGKEEAKRRKNRKNHKESSDGKNIQERTILEYVCALYNAGGGVLEMLIDNLEELDAPHSDLDEYWKTIEAKLKSLIEPHAYDDVYDREFDRGSGNVRLFIKKMPRHLATLKFNLFLPCDSSISDATYDQAMNMMFTKGGSIVKVPLHKCVKNLDKNFVYGAKVNFHESKHIQLKHFESGNILTSNRHEQCDILRKTVSAFANGNGGAIVLGVSNDGGVKGENLGEDSTDVIENRLNTLITKMYWPPSVSPTRREHWDVEFFPLEGRKNYFVIVIYVASVSGGVFAKRPLSVEYRLGEGSSQGQICQLGFDEWKLRMVPETNFQTDSEGIERVMSRFKRINLDASEQLLTIKEGVEDIRHAFFEVKDDCPVSPKAALSKLAPEAEAMIQKVQEIVKKGGNGGLLLFSRSWLRNVGHEVRPSGPGARPSGLICDLLLVSQGMGGLHLLTLCEPGSEESVTRYSLTVAKNLKRSLVFGGGCKEKFYISNHVIPCSATNIDGLDAHGLYPAVYDMGHTPEKLNKILDALVIVLAKVPSTLSSALGVNFMNLLTPLQFQLVHEEIDEPGSRELWVNGAAGSGKTLVAIEFIRKLRSCGLTKDNILYVCENEGLREQVRRVDLCRCVCRKTFMKSWFPEVKHVIMDEVQNFTAEDGDWLGEARKLVRLNDPDTPGYLWLFIDNSQVNHSFETGIPNESQQVPHFRLKKVIRNSKRIFDYSMEFMPREVKNKIELGHDFLGDSVEHKKYSKGQSRSVCLQQVLDTLFTEGFSVGDITVLYGKEDCIPRDLSTKLGRMTVTAKENNSNHLVVSTLRKYSGLERPVVVLVDLRKSLPYGSYKDSSTYCAVTRAMVKLVVIEQE